MFFKKSSASALIGGRGGKFWRWRLHIGCQSIGQRLPAGAYLHLLPQPWGWRIRRQAQPYDVGPHGLASLQMLGVLTNHPHCMGLGAITLGNLLQQAGRRLAACAMFLGVCGQKNTASMRAPTAAISRCMCK